MTPHISAKKNEISKTVLMPGDPLRAKWIAETFLEDYKLVNEVRGMLCYTGKYKGKTISVMGHGMGIPSIGIYSHELYNFYDVECIIRIGSAGSYKKEIDLGDVVLVNQAYSESSYAKELGMNEKILKPNNDIVNDIILKTANELKMKVNLGACHSVDAFYNKGKWKENKIDVDLLCVEMEAFGLFANAKLLNKKSAVLLTCSDSLVTKESMDHKERQTSFKEMVILALESAIKI